jgi:hypothetical protein
VAVVLVLGAGLLYGFWTGRWNRDESLQVALERLDRLPGAFGSGPIPDWEVMEGGENKIDDKTLQIGGIDGYKSRAYVNRLTGERVTILIVCGRPGPISVHTPDVCFKGRGFEMQGKEERTKIKWSDTNEAEFWTAVFKQPHMAVPSTMRVYWTWTPTGQWQVAENPRFVFGRYKALYKLYVYREVSPSEDETKGRPAAGENKTKGTAEDEVCVRFIKELLPHLQKSLFPESVGR